MKVLPYNNLNIPYISLLYVYQELKYNKGMKTMKNNENKKIFLKYLEIKNINKDLIMIISYRMMIVILRHHCLFVSL